MLKPTNNLLYPIIAPILDALIPPLKPMPYFGISVGVVAVLIVDGDVGIVDGDVFMVDGADPVIVAVDFGGEAVTFGGEAVTFIL